MGPQHHPLDVVVQLLQVVGSTVVPLEIGHRHVQQLLKDGGGLGHQQLSSSNSSRGTDLWVNLMFIAKLAKIIFFAKIYEFANS